MRALVLLMILLLVACAERPRVDLTITNAPASLGDCMPEKPASGCP